MSPFLVIEQEMPHADPITIRGNLYSFCIMDIPIAIINGHGMLAQFLFAGVYRSSVSNTQNFQQSKKSM